MYNRSLEFKECFIVRNIVESDVESIRFAPNLNEFREALLNKPEVFTDDIIITVYYAIIYKQKKLVPATKIVSWVEAKITGHTTAINVEKMLDLVVSYDWLDENQYMQKTKMGINIIKKLGIN